MKNFSKLISQTYTYFIEEEDAELKALYSSDHQDFVDLHYVIKAGYDFVPTLDRMDTEPRERAIIALQADGVL